MSSALTYIVLLGAVDIIVLQTVRNAADTTHGAIQIQVGRSYYTYTPGIGAHKIHSEITDWNTARRTCDEQGVHLLIINSVAEAETILELLRKSGKWGCWVGVHDLYQEGEFVTVRGESLSRTGFEGWKIGEPNNVGGGENCVVFFNEGVMMDVPCTFRQYFICELPNVL